MARFGLSRKTEYAVIALARLAQERHAGGAERVLSARELADAEALPLPVLSGLLKQLQRAGIVASRRGVHGGYHLPQAPERVHLATVIRAVEESEPVQLARCCGSDGPGSPTAATPGQPATASGTRDAHEACRLACTCPIRHAIQNLDRQLSAFLEQLTLADLMAEQNVVSGA